MFVFVKRDKENPKIYYSVESKKFGLVKKKKKFERSQFCTLRILNITNTNQKKI